MNFFCFLFSSLKLNENDEYEKIGRKTSRKYFITHFFLMMMRVVDPHLGERTYICSGGDEH